VALTQGLKALGLSTLALACATGGVAIALNQTPAQVATGTPASVLAESRQADVDSRSAERAELLAAAEARSTALATQAEAITATDAAIPAERAEAEARAQAEREEFIRVNGFTPETRDPREIARQMMASKYGWGADQFTCYDNIIMRESRWITTADNPTSSAYGIPQALPGSKMASAGADWETNPATQIKWGLGYVKDVYGTPCKAWTFKKARGWY